MGGGRALRSAQKKYGIENFKKIILSNHETAEEALEEERRLVTEEFVNDKNTYNLRMGGIGLDSSTAKKNRVKTNQILLDKYGEDWHTIISHKASTKGREFFKKRMETDPTFIEIIRKNGLKGRLVALSEESRQKRVETFKETGHQQGEKNSQFGTIWINNFIENKKIKKDEIIPEGWIKGRKILNKLV